MPALSTPSATPRLFRTQTSDGAHESGFLRRRLAEEVEARKALIKKPLDVVGYHNGGPTNFPASSLDAFISVHWFGITDDLPGTLAAIYHALKPGGVLLAALYGGGTLAELRTSLIAAETDTTGGSALRVAPMLAPGTAVPLLQRAGFSDPVVDTDVLTASYADAASLVKDLRESGMTGVLASQRPLARRTWAATAAHYSSTSGDARSRLLATFEAIYLSAWKTE